MERFFFAAGSLLALLAVALGAFAAHALKLRLSQDMLNIFETAARYQMYHALGLLAVAWASARWPESGAPLAGWSFIFGIIVFSGSLYLLALTGIRWLGAITPVGGVAFLIGWAILIWSAAR
ncbi:MAG TPA: DUF423 domain-containing protein [Candidatus Binatia bacterium]|jgi:uncharacterized membrane protein YgdD (TMEM256/DUF423 family)|nr:DUF423 domain-containing protein [Candidatus Binatia bacterium]